MLRQHQAEHPDQGNDEDRRLRRVGEDRAAQAAAQAVGQGHGGKQQGGGNKLDAARVAVIAADHRGVAPYLVEQANQNCGGKRQRRAPAVMAAQKAHQPGGRKAPTQAVDDEAGERNRQPVHGVGQAADQAVSRPQIGGVGHRFGEDPADKDAGGDQPGAGAAAAAVLAIEETAEGHGARCQGQHQGAVDHEKAPEEQPGETGGLHGSILS